MGTLKNLIRERWRESLTVLCIASVFFCIISWMTFRQYAVFHLQAPDVVLFAQSMWNTLNGEFLMSSLTGKSIMVHHFTPIFVLVAPVLWLWEDPRALFLVQTAGITVSGVIIWLIARSAAPRWAIPLTAVYFLNASLHEVAIHELRRAPFATPFVALGLYGLYKKNNWLLITGLAGALLCKEDMGVLSFTFGIFVLFIHRNWKLGSFLIVFGVVSTVFLTFCVVPSFDPARTVFGCYPQDYGPLKYFSGADSSGLESSGSMSLMQTITGILFGSGNIFVRIFDPAGLRTILRILLPLAFILPLIGFEWALLALPSAALMMLSSNPQLHTLSDWYMAHIIPILMVAVIIGVKRIPHRWQAWMMAGLIGCTLVGYALFSYLPGGRQFLPVRYQVTEHHHVAQHIVEMVPDDAAVMAQDAFTQHLSMRPELHHVRPNSWNEKSYDYLILDRNLKHYPFDLTTINSIIDERVADPNLIIAAEGDGAYLFKTSGEQPLSVQLGAMAENSILLERAEIALENQNRIFQTQEPTNNILLAPNQTLRVTLYWRAINKPVGNRTVSVRVTDETEWVVAQQDATPSNGRRPTVVWEPGWYFRDVYYLTVPEGTTLGVKNLTLLLYDSSTQERIPFDLGDELILGQVTIHTP
ncbi:MAG: DUF2079 domain-containing protein [Chloroflexota bacterium]